MPFFIQEQRDALERFHPDDPQRDDLIEFLSGTLDRFIAEKVAPGAAGNDEVEHFDAGLFRALGETGFLGLALPESLGGLGAAFTYLAAGLESLAKADAGFALGVAIHGTCTDGIARFANEELRQRYVPGLADGSKVGCFALTEPDSGSDAKALRTSFREESDAYVLSGSKYWITNAPSGVVFFVVARRQGTDEFSSFVVEPGWPGSFEVEPIKEKMGVRGSNTGMLVFDQYRIPKENLVGQHGRGFRYAMHMLNGGRITIGAWASGIAQGAYEKLLRYSHERQLFGQTLFELDNTKRELSEMLIGIHAGRLLTYAAALDKTRGREIAQTAAIAKVAASEHAVHCAERAIELAGGYGYVRDSRIERHLRDALLARIGEGANELLKVMVIPRTIAARYHDEGTPELW